MCNRAAIGVGLIVALVVPIVGQVARQGDPEAKPIPTAFHSPMILEVPFIAADRSTWGKGWQAPPAYVELGKYTVDNVSIRGPRRGSGWESGLWVRSTLRSGNRLELEIGALATNPKNNHDKSVTLHFEFLNGTQSIGTAQLGPIGAGDNGLSSPSRPMTIKITNISPEQLKTDPPTTLRLTVTARDY